jgi:glutathione peroxidase
MPTCNPYGNVTGIAGSSYWAKVRVSGDGTHPFYKWAAGQAGPAGAPRWNFHKYLIGPEGDLVNWFSTPTEPTSGKVSDAIEAQLSRADPPGG